MRKRFGGIAAPLLLAGCVTYGDKPSQTVVVAGDYQMIADCWYEKVANDGGFKKVDLPSKKLSRITEGNDDFTVMKMEFEATSDGRTRVSGFNGQAFGVHVWKTTYEPAARACSETQTRTPAGPVPTPAPH